ncbi:MAG TPA: tetratricopeptide repeat protein [Planctomycetota bacterium]|nr:tetratricopeptide repeat protein [Planctomycetota bacterium]
MALSLLILATALAFGPTLRNGWVNWDDDANFLTNNAYRGLSPTHLGWMFTTDHLGHYQPFAWVTLGLDYCLWGMNAWGYHLTSLLLHLGTVLLFFTILRLLLARVRIPATPAEDRRSILAAAVGALLYAIHPLRVESVAWVTERRDVLCGVFLLGAVWAYLKRAEAERLGSSGRTKYLLLSVGLFACSLLSKALGIMAPAVLLVLDVYPLQRFGPGQRRRVLLEKLPFLLCSIAAGAMAIHAAGAAKDAVSLGTSGLPERVEQASYGLCFYLVKSVLPVHLSTLYLAPVPFDPWAPRFLASVMGVVLILVLAVAFRRRRPEVLTAWLCYALLLVPVLGLVPVGPQIAADRYTYLAHLPWAVLAAFLVDRMLRPQSETGSPPPRSRWVLGGAGALVLALGGLTFAQTSVWADSVSLWTQALRVDPDNFVACNQLGTALAARHDASGALRYLDHAIHVYPAFAEARYNRGSLRLDAGDLAGAIEDESEAIRLAPDYGPAYQIRGMARKSKGDAEGARADQADADRLAAAARSSPTAGPTSSGPVAHAGSAEVQEHNNKGNQLASGGDFDGAIAEYSEAIRIDPGIAAIYNNRGNARASKGDQALAVRDYSEALKLDPGFAEAYANRGISRALLRDLRGALGDYTEALKIAPRDAAVLSNRGAVRASLGDRMGAVEDLKAALDEAPADWPRRPTIQSLLQRLRGP